MNQKHKVFISYHHLTDIWYKEELIRLNDKYNVFIDASVNTNEISTDLEAETVRRIIRDDYLKDSTVTILLVGKETKNRKFVDWELYSSMYDGVLNKQSGILVINLPTIDSQFYTANHKYEKEILYPNIKDWIAIESRTEYERRYPYMPARIIDNLLAKNVYISVVNWTKIIENIEYLRLLIDETYKRRTECKYDLSRPMKRNNS